LDELMETKLSYGYDLAGAFEYMHKNKWVLFFGLISIDLGWKDLIIWQ
jgi:hypothetical protein